MANDTPGPAFAKRLNRRGPIPTLGAMMSDSTIGRIGRIATRLALLATMAGVAACARIDHHPTVVQGDPAPPAATQERAAPLGPGRVRVERGDSLYAIARRSGVALRSLIDANRLSAPYVIYPGQILTLPGKRYHIVGEDETIYAISQRYRVDMGALVRVNNIPPPYRIEKGQRLRLPETGETVQTAAASSSAADTGAPKPASGPSALPSPRVRTVEPPPEPVPERTVASLPPRPLSAPPKRSGGKFLWPVRGQVLIGFGPRKGGFHNDGINIAAPEGTPVRAAENGVVAYVGNQLQGFGNLVLIKHSGGWMSAYAHNSQLLVVRGATVQRGQIIARVGKSGSVDAPQLHFELRRGDRAVDPRRYLVRYALLMTGPAVALARD